MAPDNSLRWMTGGIIVTVAGMIAIVLWMQTPRPEVAVESKDVRTPSNVAWTKETLEEVNSGDVVRGMVLARRCEKCHGTEGFSDSGEVPNLASMSKLAFWKQLEDFRTGKRRSPLMQPVAAVLTRRDEADLDAYYALLPAIPDPQDTRVQQTTRLDANVAETASRLVTLGDGARGIPPCQACHGPVGTVNGAPSLATQNADYILDQLDNFADGSRANDINLPMRSIAHQLTEEERKDLSSYYGAGLGTHPGAANPRWQKK